MDEERSVVQTVLKANNTFKDFSLGVHARAHAHTESFLCFSGGWWAGAQRMNGNEDAHVIGSFGAECVRGVQQQLNEEELDRGGADRYIEARSHMDW